MQASSPATLSLAGRLRDTPDDELVDLLTVREARDARIRDFFDLADALLDAASLSRAFARLDRATLATLAAASSPLTTEELAARLGGLADDAAASLETAHSLALIDRSADGRWTTYPPVLDQLATFTTLDELVGTAPPAVLAPVPEDDPERDRAAAERAFATTTSVGAVLSELQREPARELARGGLALPEAKRLATVADTRIEDAGILLEIAERAGLAELDGGRWRATPAAADWMLRSGPERWARLAAAWVERLSPDIRRLLRGRARARWGEHLEEYLDWLYPAGGDWLPERVATYTRDAQLLGITASSVPSRPGSALLTDGESGAAEAMGALFPAETDTVYLQHDLTIVSTGPLTAVVDARLRSLADVESRALASTYRVSEASLARAFASGDTADAIREFLAGVALTGVPQPLEYLIAGTAARFGSVRVGTIVHATDQEHGAVSYVTVEEPSVLSTMLVDHALAPIGLRRISPRRAVSRFDPAIVFWSIADARYPVAAEDATGRVITVGRAEPPRSSGAPAGETVAERIVRRLRVNEPAGGSTAGTLEGGDATDRAWLERQLDLAVRGKLAVAVSVTMPDGSTVELQLEPASVAGGRLRARDRRTDLERTLPLSSITSVVPL